MFGPAPYNIATDLSIADILASFNIGYDKLILGITEQLAITRFRQLLTDFDEALNGGKIALQKVTEIDQKLGKELEKAECDAMFTFPWYTTWFLHSLSSVEVGARLLDFFIAADSNDLILFITAMIISKRNDVFQLEEIEYSEIHSLFTNATKDFTIENIQQLINMTVYLRSHTINLQTLISITSDPYNYLPSSLSSKNILLIILLCIIVMIISFFITNH